MRVLLISDLCSPETYKKLIPPEFRMGQQSQKYLRLLCEGLVANSVIVKTISIPPVNSENNKRHNIKLSKELCYGSEINYIAITNFPIIRNIMTFFRLTNKLVNDRFVEESVIILDMLSVTTLVSTLIAKLLKKRKVLGILTDMPMVYVGNENSRITMQQRINQWLCRIVPDAYLFLSEPMNEMVNFKNKPHVIIEGFSDKNMASRNNKLSNKDFPRVIFYAGGLKKEYGLDMLVEGFIRASIPQCELHICGDGSYTEELLKYCTRYESIKYLGVLDNEKIIENEERATLLVNPRYSNSEFVKYSFPSKNMEYFASGTPMLGTRLPSLPVEYYEHMFFVKEESVDGMALALQEVFSKSDEELYLAGEKAKEWAIKEKSNVVLSKRLIKTIELTK